MLVTDRGSQRHIRKAARRRELSQNPFLPVRRPRRKMFIMMNDLSAGMLDPEIKRYRRINGREIIAAAWVGVMNMVTL